MAVVTGLTAARMAEIEAASVVSGEVVGDNLILTRHDDSTIDAGSVRGTDGVDGTDGTDGADGTPGIGWRGVWSAVNSYLAGQIVRYSGTTRIANRNRAVGQDVSPEISSAGVFPPSVETGIATIPIADMAPFIVYAPNNTSGINGNGVNYFHIDVLTAGTLGVTLSTLNNNYYATLYNGAGTYLAGALGSGNIAPQSVTPGRYYLRIGEFSGGYPRDTNVQLNGTFVLNPDSGPPWTQLSAT